MMRSFLDRMWHGDGARTARATTVPRGTNMPRNLAIASALTSAIFLVGLMHAPAMPVAAGAAIACMWLRRTNGGS